MASAVPTQVGPGAEQSEAQTSATVLLVRPACFGFNGETAASNAFARRDGRSDVQALALAEFDHLEQRLADAGVETLVLPDESTPATPDAVFPNNWVSFHADGTLVTYPMATPTRRMERELERLSTLLTANRFEVRRHIDLSGHEVDGRFLEGTGSLILDRPRRQAHACIGPRTDPAVIAEFDRLLGYSTFTFDAVDPGGRPIYHTNVILSLGRRFAALCSECVPAEQRSRLLEALEASGRTVVELSFEQVRSFACNIIELGTARGEQVIAMSAAAKASLRPDQVRALETLGGEVIEVAIPTIEAVGGGSVRCMIADVHLPRRD